MSTFEVKDVITIVTIALSAGVAWGTVRSMISKHEKEIQNVKRSGSESVEKIEEKIKEIAQKQEDAIKSLSKKIEELEKALQRALDHDTAEKKFVTQRELQLRLENIYSQINSIDKKIDILIEYIKGKGGVDL